MNEVILIMTFMFGDIKGPTITQWYPSMESCKTAAEGTNGYANKEVAKTIHLKKQCIKQASSA